tara:strand:- start:7573 stop:7914 length:342 start_codon:yes stop_codon:yes gene_type:complete
MAIDKFIGSFGDVFGSGGKGGSIFTKAIGVGLGALKNSLTKKQSGSSFTPYSTIKAEKTSGIPTSRTQFSTTPKVSASMDTATRIVRRAEAIMKPVSISKGIGEGTSPGLRNV